MAAAGAPGFTKSGGPDERLRRLLVRIAAGQGELANVLAGIGDPQCSQLALSLLSGYTADSLNRLKKQSVQASKREWEEVYGSYDDRATRRRVQQAVDELMRQRAEQDALQAAGFPARAGPRGLEQFRQATERNLPKPGDV